MSAAVVTAVTLQSSQCEQPLLLSDVVAVAIVVVVFVNIYYSTQL